MPDVLPLSAEEIVQLRKLLEVEKVRKVAQLYSHLMDGRDWEALAGLYAEDAVCDWGPYGKLQGRDAIHKQLVAAHPGRLPYDGFHVTTNLWVELTGEDTAISRNYLTDMWPAEERGPICHEGWPANPVILYAIYENDYRKIGQDWKISRSAIQFVWPARITGEGFPRDMTPTPIG
jgi:hypothetical protein